MARNHAILKQMMAEFYKDSLAILASDNKNDSFPSSCHEVIRNFVIKNNIMAETFIHRKTDVTKNNLSVHVERKIALLLVQ